MQEGNALLSRQRTIIFVLMNKLKAHRVLLILSIALAIVFAVLLIVDDGDNVLGQIGGWTGLTAQVLLAISQILEIRRIKKEGME